MTTLLVPWLAFPLVLAVLSLGCGLLLEWVAGFRLPGPLLLPCGLCVVVLVALFPIMAPATAELATPAVIAAAVAGFGLAIGRVRRPRVDAWALGASLGAFAVYAAPVVFSGRPTFPGYMKLDDDATFLANLDRAMEHGRSLDGLEPSTYLATLTPHLAEGYPLGAVIPIGVVRELVRGDVLWLYHPCVAFVAAMLALALYELTARVVEARWLRSLAAFIGAQSALLYGYALWGGLKEVAAAAVIALAAALVGPALRAPGGPRSFLPLAVAAAALVSMLSIGGAIWLVPPLVAALVGVLLTRARAATFRAVVAFIAFFVVLAAPTIVVSPSFFERRVFELDYLANLIAPLSAAQLAGIWLTGDFRYTPDRESVTYVLVAVAVVAAAAGLVWAVKRRAWELPVYVIGIVAGCFAFYPFSTPWIEGKALATASAAIPLAALVACAPLFARGRRVEGAVLAAVVSGGVLWSNALQYHDAWLAPWAQLRELESIGNRFAGDGPTLMTEYQPYGARHFLRKLDGEGAGELRSRPVALRGGKLLEEGEFANLDEFELDAILVYRTLTLRTSPVESRPPSVYQLVSHGRWYDVWQKPKAEPRRILEHLPLGTDFQPASVPTCADVLRLARVAGSDGLLAAVERTPAVAVDLSAGSYPAGWKVTSSRDLLPTGAGTMATSLEVPAAGRYEVWLGGRFRNRLELVVDGKRIFAGRNQLNWSGTYTPLGPVDLGAGSHRLELRYGGPDLHPGSGGGQFAMGPLVLSVPAGQLPVRYLRPAAARSLCGRNLDWIEALGQGWP